MLRLLLLSLIVIRWSAVGFDFGYGYGRKLYISFGRGFGYGHKWTSVTAPLSATSETRKSVFGRFLILTYKVLRCLACASQYDRVADLPCAACQVVDLRQPGLLGCRPTNLERSTCWCDVC